jgi:hypothetical protein
MFICTHAPELTQFLSEIAHIVEDTGFHANSVPLQILFQGDGSV